MRTARTATRTSLVITRARPARGHSLCRTRSVAYAGLRSDSAGVDPARAPFALHQAVRRVRDGHGLRAGSNWRTTPLLWAAYLHARA